MDRNHPAHKVNLNQEAFALFNGGEPGDRVQTDEEIMDWWRDAETALHPAGTAKMGRDEMAVIDPSSMSVHGTEGLRGRRLRTAGHHQRQYLRADDDGGRAGDDLILGNEFSRRQTAHHFLPVTT